MGITTDIIKHKSKFGDFSCILVKISLYMALDFVKPVFCE